MSVLVNQLERKSQVAGATLVSGKIVGFVEDISSSGIVRGWAVDERQTGVAAQVTAILNDRLGPSFVCTEPRPDLALGNSGAIPVGFSFQLSREFLNGQVWNLTFRRTKGKQTVRFGGLHTVKIDLSDQDSLELQREDRKLTGWVKAISANSRILNLEIIVDKQILTVVSFEKNRNSEICHISLKLPDSLWEDNRQHEIIVRHFGTEKIVGDGPLLLRESEFAGEFSSLLGNRVTGWCYDTGLRVVPQLKIYVNDTFVKDVSCNHFNQHAFDNFRTAVAGFDEAIPRTFISELPSSIDIRFRDGTSVPGGPRTMSQSDLAIIDLENAIAQSSHARFNGTRRYDDELEIISKLIIDGSFDANLKKHAARASEISQDLLLRIFTECDAQYSFMFIRTLSLLGVNVSKNHDTLGSFASVLQVLPDMFADAVGLVELERQRRRTITRILLAAALLAKGMSDQAVDVIYQTFWSAQISDRATIVNVGCSLMMRAGLTSAAVELMTLSILNGQEGRSV